jgi:hypothetical protein
VVSDIGLANLRPVIVFLGTCYSGTIRGTDMLIASRPIAIKALEKPVPDNFTVMTAARGGQTAKPLGEAKHGMFSFFLIKGLKGMADNNHRTNSCLSYMMMRTECSFSFSKPHRLSEHQSSTSTTKTNLSFSPFFEWFSKLNTIMHAIVFSLDWCCFYPAVVMERLDIAAVI